MMRSAAKSTSKVWRQRQAGLSLLEMMVTIGIASIVLAMVMTLYIFSLKSFGAMNNYAEMDAKSRMSIDTMLKEMRQASAVVGYQTNGSTRWLMLTNSNERKLITYTWDPTAATLVCDKTGSPTHTNLTGCDNWSFGFYMRVPTTNGTFFSAGNNLAITKLISMSWTCSRSNIIRKINTESVMTAQVVLRNPQK